MLRALSLLLLAVAVVGCDRRSSGAGSFLATDSSESPTRPSPSGRDPLPLPGSPPSSVAPAAPEQYATTVDHSLLPLRVGSVWVYEGEADGQLRRDVLRVRDGTVPIMGIPCVAIEQEVTLDGQLAEHTTEWFAQDLDGNVWKFGEESFEVSDLASVRTDDSWVAGADGRQPWLFLGAEPRIGDVYSDGEDFVAITAIGVTASVPAGTFHGSVEATENLDDPDDKDIIIYTPTVGMISEQSTTGAIELVEHVR